MRFHVAQSLTEAAQARESAFLARDVEKAVLIQARSESYHLAQSIHDRRVTVVRARDDHVEAIRAEIDCGHDLRGVGWRGCLHLAQSRRTGVRRRTRIR